jgi:hypothetical protein
MKTLLFLILTLPFGFPHGEDQAGPHGGYIRMPGAFHTELVQDQQNFKDFLLDINWANPTVQNSKVSAVFKPKKGKAIESECTPQSDYFLCSSGKLKISNLKSLDVVSSYKGDKHLTATYDLPLKLHKK